jgi:hypothetical protein
MDRTSSSPPAIPEAPQTVVLDDDAFAAEREALCRRQLGISAAEFTRRAAAGEFDGDAYCDAAEVFAWFPELDGPDVEPTVPQRPGARR